MTGTYDRWAEALIESSYGRLSLLSDPVVLPILDMPKGANPGQNAFTYSEAPIAGHLMSLGWRKEDFHTIVVRMHWACPAKEFNHMTQLKAGLLPVILPVVASKWISAPLQGVHVVQVLSPLPRFVNPGFTAWSNAGGSQLVFVMRCNPQVRGGIPLTATGSTRDNIHAHCNASAAAAVLSSIQTLQ